ncbi:MAG: hypothetical protein C0519_14035 [Hyphomicrobium sp.]|nr:hypothetical protein [Hyphomicrobium sp.]PPD06275.1 MAG: hypothetical protein CTY28_14410 [Hyphomicrobium sp.]
MSAILDEIKQAIIPFSALRASDEINARPLTKEGIDALAASILAKGIIQPLAVRPSDDGKYYELIDGRRRHAALAKLVKDKRLPKGHPVPVIIRNEDDEQALESSLIANTVRLPMHPVDQHVVFAKLAGEGASDADIAARFGISERTVRQQKALGRLAPAIREAWKKEKISPEVARAFAEHGDTSVQEALFEKLKKQGPWALSEHNIRREFGVKRVPAASCEEFLLVGEDAYLAAGGTLTDSLFEEDRFVDDLPLAKKLARERLQAECERLKSEGWVWAKVSLDDDDPREWDFDSIREEVAHDETSASYTAEERARGGCLVGIDLTRSNPPFAEIAIAYGFLVRDGEDGDEGEDDLLPIRSVIGDDDDEDAEPDADDASPLSDDPFKISGALMQAITEAKTRAASEALTADPKIAQIIITAALLSRYIAPSNVSNNGFPELRRERFDSFAEGLAALLKMNTDAVEVLFAEAVASTLDLRESVWQFKSRDSGIDTLIAALPGRWYLSAMRRHFLAADYFKRATKETALAAIAEIKEAGHGGNLAPIDELAAMKKADLAQAAAEAALACGWLPPQLRHPDYTLNATATNSEAA